MDYSQIITMEPGKRSGKPCIRGLRMTVGDVLGSRLVDALRDVYPECQQRGVGRGPPDISVGYQPGM
jgi:uncharacterized protein (DUF433 family)